MSKLPRYCVTRTLNGEWAVIDRTRVRLHGDVVASFKARNLARLKAQELNLQEMQEKNTTGDAA